MRISVSDYMARVSRWRGHIMGFSILCILFFHSGIRVSEPWNYFFNLLWGVDIFFFCTGLGVHRSLSNNPEAPAFYKRRFWRIYPAYLPVVLVFFAPILVRAISAVEIWSALVELLGNVLLLGWVNELEHQFNWYPQAIALLYLAAPALFVLVRACAGRKGALIALFAFFIVSQPCFFNGNLLILWSRLPYFMLGLIGAELSARNSRISMNIPVLMLLFLVGNYLMYYGQRYPTEILWGYGLSWYPGLLILPGALFILPWLFERVERVGVLSLVNRALAVMGKRSFEIFLVHLLVFMYVSVPGEGLTANLLWLALIALCIPLSIAYGKIVDKVKNALLKT